MFCCYLDESGTPEVGAQTSHFVLLGLAIPAHTWHSKDAAVGAVKRRCHLSDDTEIHTGFMARRFPEQEHVAGLEAMSYPDRRTAVATARKNELIRIAATGTPDQLKQRKKQFAKTDAYIHLTFTERHTCLEMLADEVRTWGDARIFGAAIDKRRYARTVPIFDYAFEQLVSRFHTFLNIKAHLSGEDDPAIRTHRSVNMGLLIEDNNETVEKRLTELMRRFHTHGTLWQVIDRIIETPLFVDSSLTSMVQVADLCAYAVRRFFENGERNLFDRIVSRIDRRGTELAGLMHYTGGVTCTCEVCASRAG
jgi:hypothetical protein